MTTPRLAVIHDDAEGAPLIYRFGTLLTMGPEVTVNVVRSELDGALIVQVDTNFQPDGSDGGPGLRVDVNDNDAWAGKPYVD